MKVPLASRLVWFARKRYRALRRRLEILWYWGRRLTKPGLFHSPVNAATILRARNNHPFRGRILFIDDRVPFSWLGAGLPRTAQFLRALVDLDYFVSFFPTLQAAERWEEVYGNVSRDIEVVLGYGSVGLNDFLRTRESFYDVCIVSRPHNMARLGKALCKHFKQRHAPVIYDAEALFCMREIRWCEVQGHPLTEAKRTKMIADELSLTAEADAIVSVSESEAASFRAHGQKVYVLPHAVSVVNNSAPFAPRVGFIFVGGLQRGVTPNGDSVFWFIENILPLIRACRPEIARLVIAGINAADIDFSSFPGVQHLGRVDELQPIYDGARVFVAPTRFSAGVPLKIYEAAAAGLPVVATTLLANQLGWKPGEELLVADMAADFAKACIQLHENESLWQRIRSAAATRVQAECSRERFRSQVERIVTGTVDR